MFRAAQPNSSTRALRATAPREPPKQLWRCGRIPIPGRVTQQQRGALPLPRHGDARPRLTGQHRDAAAVTSQPGRGGAGREAAELGAGMGAGGAGRACCAGPGGSGAAPDPWLRGRPAPPEVLTELLPGRGGAGRRGQKAVPGEEFVVGFSLRALGWDGWRWH